MSCILIKGGNIVTEAEILRADVLVVDGKIAAIGRNLEDIAGLFSSSNNNAISGNLASSDVSDSFPESGKEVVSDNLASSDVSDSFPESGKEMFSDNLASSDVSGSIPVTGKEMLSGNFAEKNSSDDISANKPTTFLGQYTVIDASGKYVLPGAVDAHTHMDLDVGFTRACDDFYTGTVAAACGGTTTIIDHMAFGPKGCSLWHQVEEYHRLADGAAAVDYGFHGVLQHVHSETLGEMRDIADREGITSFKAYMTYADRLSDEDLFRGLRTAREYGILIAAHCENDGVINCLRGEFVRDGQTAARYHPLSRPAEAEAEAVNRFLCISAMAGNAPAYIVHLSSAAGLLEVKKALAQDEGKRHKNIGVETCTQYLTLTDALYDDPREGLKAIMSPPLRKDADRDALWGALADKIIDVVGTDHCPFLFSSQKQRGAEDFTLCPNGAPGVQERLAVMFSEGFMKGRISLPRLVQCCCANPAKIFGIYPQKGSLQPGTDADIVIIDPEKEYIFTAADIRGAADYSCYEGMRLHGAVDTVLLRGEVVARDGSFCGKRGGGRYLKRGRSTLAESR